MTKILRLLLLATIAFSSSVQSQTNQTNDSQTGTMANSSSHLSTTQSERYTTDTLTSGTGSINHHEFVDLGLSVKWATCNIGASTPEQYGSYFAWGDTKEKSTYLASNTVFRKEPLQDITGSSRYDAARVHWGTPWRMPTKSECEELISNCTWTMGSHKGVSGYFVKSKKNGRSIFLPAAGLRESKNLTGNSEYGYYWSSSAYPDTSKAYRLGFHSENRYTYQTLHFYGLTVRPVSE